MESLIESFLDYVTLECGLSDNTREAYFNDLSTFDKWCSKSSVHDPRNLTRDHLTRFLFDQQKRGLAPRSLSRCFVTIKLFFRYLLREQHISSDITDVMDSPKLWKVLPGVLSQDEVDRLLKSPQGDSLYAIRDTAIFELMYAAGLRVSECVNVCIDDIQFDESSLRTRGKGNKVRIVPFGRSAMAAMQRYLQEVRPVFQKDPAVRNLFLTRSGKSISRKTLWAMVKKYAKSAGIQKNVHPHTLRHSFASHMLSNDAPLRVIQELLGHADISTTQIYTHVDQSRLKTIHSHYHPRA
jgi:integrase/recombinase XerD